MTAPFADQQAALLGALWETRAEDACAAIAPHVAQPSGGWRRGVAAHRANAQGLARSALAATFPVTARLMGGENFEGVAVQLWYRHPPSRGDVGEWGGDFAAYIETIPEAAASEPYLPDVARVEWALHCAARAADAAADHASFKLLVERDAADVTLDLSPGTQLVTCRYPVVGVINAHRDADPAFEEAARQLARPAAQTALVWRQGRAARVRRAAAGEAAFVDELERGRSVLHALQAAPAFDFAAWLTPAVESGLVVAAR